MKRKSKMQSSVERWGWDKMSQSLLNQYAQLLIAISFRGCVKIVQPHEVL